MTKLSLDGLDAAIFDLDGVVTHTASIHARAWKQAFDRYLEKLRSRGSGPFEPFDETRDYREYVDGKPRYDGVRSFLASRGIALPEGAPADEPGTETVQGLGNLKNELYLQLLQSGGAEVFQDAVDLVAHCAELRMKTAVVSSSRNCATVLESTGLSALFDVRVDGVDLQRLGLRGKPEPDLFLEAARRLKVEPGKSAVFEDSVAGVEAGRKGGFALVIGVDRTGDGSSLSEHGAHLTVRTLAVLQGAGRKVTEAFVTSSDGRELRSEIERSVDGRRLAVFLDYDGTLTPIVRTPEEAILSDTMREAVRELASLCTVAVVSGRDRKDVESFVRLEELVYAGSHGFDIAGPRGLRMENEEARARLGSLDVAEEELRGQLAEVPGARVERKRYGLAIHYRNSPEDQIQTIRQEVDEVAANHPDLRRRGGKKVFELQPGLDWDKGKAVLWLLRKLDLVSPDVLPVYLGDDLTDEDAFRVLAGRGLRFVVGPLEHGTEADYLLKDVADVELLLRGLARLLRDRPRSSGS